MPSVRDARSRYRRASSFGNHRIRRVRTSVNSSDTGRPPVISALLPRGPPITTALLQAVFPFTCTCRQVMAQDQFASSVDVRGTFVLSPDSVMISANPLIIRLYLMVVSITPSNSIAPVAINDNRVERVPADKSSAFLPFPHGCIGIQNRGCIMSEAQYAMMTSAVPSARQPTLLCRLYQLNQ